MNEFQNFTTKNLEIIRNKVIRPMFNLHVKKNNILIGGVIHKKINGSYDLLKQLLLLEEFKSCVSTELKIYLNNHNVDALCLAARCADKYSMIRKDTSTKIQDFQKLNYHTSQTVFQKSSTTIMPDQIILIMTLSPYLFPLALIARKRDTPFPIVSL